MRLISCLRAALTAPDCLALGVTQESLLVAVGALLYSENLNHPRCSKLAHCHRDQCKWYAKPNDCHDLHLITNTSPSGESRLNNVCVLRA